MPSGEQSRFLFHLESYPSGRAHFDAADQQQRHEPSLLPPAAYAARRCGGLLRRRIRHLDLIKDRSVIGFVYAERFSAVGTNEFVHKHKASKGMLSFDIAKGMHYVRNIFAQIAFPLLILMAVSCLKYYGV